MLRAILFVFYLLSFGISNAQLIDYDKLDTAKVYTSIKEAIENPNQVYRLDLSKKKLTEFPEEIFELTNLNELILDKNKIDSIPSSISILSNLQRISVYRNYLVNFEFVTELPNLISIDLTSNYLEEVPTDISNLFKLKTLILQLNTIVIFPNSMIELEALEELNLLDNELNRDQQEKIRKMFPDIKVDFSAPCNCNFDEE